MNLFELTQALVDIESTTGNEERVGAFLNDYLSSLARKYEGRVERMEVEGARRNVFACWGKPVVTLSTHMDTVPPYVPFRESEDLLWGRGVCDAKGIIASMIKAAEALLAEGVRSLGLLFVVGEERNSVGAVAAAGQPRGSRYLINGEPTENRLALGSKGTLRYEVTSKGRMAHSAYPELGESAIDKLLDALEEIRRIPLASDPVLGASTLNIGTLSGGRAPNVVPDHANAEIMIRLVGDPAATRAAVEKAVAGRADAREMLYIPAKHMRALDGFESTIVAFTTDIPALGDAWGEPFLVGPGSIQVAHTLEERISKKQLLEAVEVYRRLVGRLLAAT